MEHQGNVRSLANPVNQLSKTNKQYAQTSIVVRICLDLFDILVSKSLFSLAFWRSRRLQKALGGLVGRISPIFRQKHSRGFRAMTKKLKNVHEC